MTSAYCDSGFWHQCELNHQLSEMAGGMTQSGVANSSRKSNFPTDTCCLLIRAAETILDQEFRLSLQPLLYLLQRINCVLQMYAQFLAGTVLVHRLISILHALIRGLCFGGGLSRSPRFCPAQ